MSYEHEYVKNVKSETYVFKWPYHMRGVGLWKEEAMWQFNYNYVVVISNYVVVYPQCAMWPLIDIYVVVYPWCAMWLFIGIYVVVFPQTGVLLDRKVLGNSILVCGGDG